MRGGGTTSFNERVVMKVKTRGTVRKTMSDMPTPQGWRTTDEEEIQLRQWRAATEPMEVRPLDSGDPFYGAFAVQSKSSLRPYRVEIRSLTSRENSCDCVDFRVNGLGTCKHVEATLARLRRRGCKAYEAAGQSGPSCAEVYLTRKGSPEVRLLMPAKASAGVRNFFAPFFGSSGALLADSAAALPALLRAWKSAPKSVRTGARLAHDVEEWDAELARRRARVQAREDFLNDVKAGKGSLDVVRGKLYPYQTDGMLHLAFGERVMLADEMGLGKTVQAVAACELLRQTRQIERVLVVSPASLKTEWEEQIAKFTGLPVKTIWGGRASRLQAYRERSFFYLCNYEQARADVIDLNRLIAPDVVILDEAQRIKNWQTKTAQSIKQLSSPYAFVLTGTPLENRIDEVYSIVQFLDPAVFGPLFRFNREFYDLDERGRPAGLKNLPELHRRLRPVMLRRRKDEVEDQLPERTVNNYFAVMDEEQRLRYSNYEARVAKLMFIAKRRPLMKEEGEKLQRWLACMRMLCDTPFILDPDCRVCPKLEELSDILEDVTSSGDSKIIVFSEWERMLQLVRGLAEEMKLGYAWHTGSVPQQKRRADINRFKQDPACRLFLSTDSGATGLNLQAANVVINLDLPWNPAKLEQRIARAWRKHQTRAVQVINLVCENSIEHRMLSTLAQKQQLADGVLDGRGDLENIQLPSGRAAFMARLQALMGAESEPPVVAAKTAPPAPQAVEKATPPDVAFSQDLAARLGSRLVALEARTDSQGRPTLLAVVDGPAEQNRPLAERLLRENFADSPAPALEVLDRSTFETIQRLVQSGVLKLNSPTRVLHRDPALVAAEQPEKTRRRQAARRIEEQAARKYRMSALLKEGGFVVEAVPSLREAVELCLKAASCLVGPSIEGPAGAVPLEEIETLLAPKGLLPADAAGVVARLREVFKGAEAAEESIAAGLFASGGQIVEHAQQALLREALS